MFCPQCGKEQPDGTQICSECGRQIIQAAQVAQAIPATNTAQPEAYAPASGRPVQGSVVAQNQPAPNVVVNQVVQQKNGVGTAGFVLALVAIFTSWIPALGWIVWLLGAILSVVGLAREPRGLAIAGMVISFIDIIILIMVAGAIGCVGMSM